MNVKIVQVVMRHSTIKLKLDTHEHLLPGQEAEAVQWLGRFFQTPSSESALRTGTDDVPIDPDDGGAEGAQYKSHPTCV